MEYYVYIYLNPLKPGNYSYGSCEFEYEPFYVGMCKKSRYRQHLYKHSLKLKSHKNNIIKKIIENDLIPIIIKVYENLSCDDAKNSERKLIKLIGRFDMNNGTLSNRTNGGDSSGYTHTEKSLIKMREYQQNNHPFRNKKRPNHSNFMKKNNPMFININRVNHLMACNTDAFVSNARNIALGENNNFYGKTHTQETKDKLKKQFSIGVNQIDISSLEIISTFSSIKDASTNLSLSNISQCCRGLVRSSGGYFWEYSNHKLNEKYSKLIYHIRKIKRHIRKIAQMDLNNNIIEIFDNAKIASDVTNSNQCGILKCCKDKYTQEISNGFRWEYLNNI